MSGQQNTKNELDNATGINDIVAKYKKRLSQQLGAELSEPIDVSSREYQEFKRDTFPAHLSLYEKMCLFAGKTIRLKVNDEKNQLSSEDLRIGHLAITPTDAYSFAILYPLLYIVLGGILSLLVFDSVVFTLFFLVSGIFLMMISQRIPGFIANQWRMKASNQMVLCIFYVVTYMRHTSNLELAIRFASEHLAMPLSLDMRKLVWDVETHKHDTIKEALDVYLEGWRKWNNEFSESMHLIESSLLEGNEARRIDLLDKALDVILDETYEKMMHYAQNLKSPITMLHMLGVILPILGLVVLPLVVSFMEGVKWYHIGLLYNIILPAIVYYISKNILNTRPTGYGDVDLAELVPELEKYKKLSIKIGKKEFLVNPIFISILFCATFFLIGILPLIIHAVAPLFELELFSGLKLLEYRTGQSGLVIGPYGFGAAILSLFIPLAFAIGLGFYYQVTTNRLMIVRDQAKRLEKEFASALFQLSNRLGDGVPAEIAFDKVAEVMEDSVSGQFFRLVSANIRKLGMGVREAIFNPRTGALTAFPSNIIHSAMKVLIESVQKGPRIAAQALNNVSRYIKEIHKVNERLKDLMTEIISDIKSQTIFLTPMISGIVIGITSMITSIMTSLRNNITSIDSEQLGQLSTIANLFGDGIPTYYFQIVVGLYVVEIIYILTIMSNGIENGADKLSEQNSLGKNLVYSVFLYVAIAFIVMLVFNLIATKILSATISAGVV
ncbi:MAG: hypothetical protein Q7K43_06630 [Candidatus Woesearchaeota archaeon]|nr:hypothetical protein [Candidatus Woesearchaeota archaeon]